MKPMDADLCARLATARASTTTPIRTSCPPAALLSSMSSSAIETPDKVIPAKKQQLKYGAIKATSGSEAVVKISVPPLKTPNSKLTDLFDDKSKFKKHCDLQSKSVFKKRPLSHRELIHGWW